MLFGREPVLPLDVSIIPPSRENDKADDYVNKFKERLGRLQQKGIFNLQKQQQSLESTRPPMSQLPHFENGAKVWVFQPAVPIGLSRKLRRAWRGPYIVIKKTGPKSYIVKALGTLNLTEGTSSKQRSNESV